MTNQDYNRLFPNQKIDNDQTECVALTVSDICGNLDGKIYDPDIVYAYTLRLMGIKPTTGGSDPFTGMLMPVVYGNLPISEADFSAKTMGELYVANWQNYSQEDRISALKNVKNGIITLDNYKAIQNFLSKNQGGVCLAVRWYESFNTPNQDGTLPAPIGSYSYHCVAVYEDTEKGLRIKPWLGNTFGDGGYVYLTETVFNLIEMGMWGYDPNAWRWLSLAFIALVHPYVINDILPSLKASQSTSMVTIAPKLPQDVSNVPTPTIPSFPPRIIRLGQLIGQQENARPDLMNPGDLKYSTLTASWGASKGFQATDGGWIAKFSTLEIGTKALCNFLLLACENELLFFHQARTLEKFLQVYAGNPPVHYTQAIIDGMGVPGNTDISTFLS